MNVLVCAALLIDNFYLNKLFKGIDDFVEKTKYKLERTLNKNKRNQLHITDNNLKSKYACWDF